MAMAFAELLNQEALALQADGVDIIQFDEPAFNVYMDEAAEWGVQSPRARRPRPHLHHRRAYLLRLRHRSQQQLEKNAGRRMAPVRKSVSSPGQKQHSAGELGMHALACAMELMKLLEGKDVMVGVIDVANPTIETPEEIADTIGRALQYVPKKHLIACTNCGLAPMSREVASAKLEALAAGARLARERYASLKRSLRRRLDAA
jgi:5-methyltetrahydropteroyltriglutamate--homocysteine methyltransferase